MLVAAFVILAVAVLLGSVLAALHLQTEGRAAAPWRLAALHGLLLITMAALVGGGLLAAHVFKRRIAGIMIGVHATLAVSGFVILAAYVFAG
jgi:hypothetical protein